jgi:hypothetical protein
MVEINNCLCALYHPYERVEEQKTDKCKAKKATAMARRSRGSPFLNPLRAVSVDIGICAGM